MAAYFDSPLAFYPEENADDLRAEFVRYKVLLKNNASYNDLAICQHIFRNLRDPDRYIVAAQVWGQDIEVAEAINLATHGQINTSDKQADLEARFMAIADSSATFAKDKINALLAVAQMNGFIIKQVDKKTTNINDSFQRIVFVEDID